VPQGLRLHEHVAQGSIYDEVLRAARELGCDCIVMGSHRPELKDYLLGPNAARVVRHAPCSVMVVRA
jgi:nucleotide-binding universal stress UspA family protein